ARLQKHFSSFGQEHVFGSNFDSLAEEGKCSLLDQLEKLDLAMVNEAYKSVMAGNQGGGQESEISPVQNIANLADAAEEQKSAWWDTGLNAICEGRVAALILSGGQGTRLGYDGAKGTYSMPLQSGKTLFQLFCERVFRLKQLAREKSKSETTPSLPLYIMTSPLNDKEIKDFFSAHNHFDLPATDVVFFAQGTLPCLTLDGKIILERPDLVAQAPAGNGSIYPALVEGGALEDMSRRGVEFLHVFSVDNAICTVADPVFLGYCIARGADCGNKVVWKADINEKVGVCVEKDGKPSILEYSEMPPELNEQVDEAGKPVYGAGNICNHFFTVAFIRDTVLPRFSGCYHAARKKVPFADPATGETVRPGAPNGLKLEAFIFDAFPLAAAGRFALLEVPRAGEFAPVKNAPGAAAGDTPEAAAAALHAQ
ncbi:unnamed protein product, partial [Heterosigma akashiwo]